MVCPPSVVLETSLDLPLIARGKVRDIYALDEGLLFIATDRISAFDCILGSGIPCKGTVLTQMSLFWFGYLSSIVPNHILQSDYEQFPEHLQDQKQQLEGRSLLVKRARMIPVECVARGYLSGSGWKEYQREGSVCGIRLPKGLREGDRLPEPLFTPATKAQSGHDMNVPFQHVANEIGTELAQRLQDLTLRIYTTAAKHAEECGLILADTKFEFGFVRDELVLADEVLTPDSSRYWPADRYQPGGPQFSFDKQYVRDYLETLDWNKTPPAPGLPDDVVANTSAKYREAFQRLTGQAIEVQAV